MAALQLNAKFYFDMLSVADFVQRVSEQGVDNAVEVVAAVLSAIVALAVVAAFIVAVVTAAV